MSRLLSTPAPLEPEREDAPRSPADSGPTGGAGPAQLEPCRILLLEDVVGDAELNERELRRAGIEFVARRVDTREDFQRALGEYRPDLVLSDFSLPGFDALSALQLLLAHNPDTPFIIVTGSMSEEAAVECMKAGATDYVVKDKLTRLAPAVLGALQKRRLADARRRAEAALSASEQRYRSLMEHANDAILILDPGRHILEANRQAERLLGRSREQLVGHGYAELVAPEERAAAQAHTAELLRSRTDRVQNRQLQRFDGTPVFVDLSASLVQVGDETLALAILRDVTERKRAEEAARERERLAQFTAEVSAALVHDEPLAQVLRRCCDAAVRCLDAAFARIWTLNRSENVLELQASAGLYTHTDGPHGRVPVGKFKIGLIAEERQPHLTNSVIGDVRVGDQAWARREGMVAFAGYPLLLGERVVGVIAMFARKPLSEAVLQALSAVAHQIALAIQRATDHEGLREAQQRLHHVVSSSPAVLYSLRPVGNRLVSTWVSENVERLLGFTPEEALRPEWWSDNLHSQDRDQALAELPTLFAEDSLDQEYRFRTKAGAYRWVRAELRLLRDEDGEPTEAVGSWSDVTDRKDAELQFEESAQQYRLLFDSNPQPMWVYAHDTLEFLAVNAAALDKYGYTLGEFLGMTIRDIRPPADLAAFEERVAARRRDAGGRLGPSTWTHLKKDGTPLQVEITSAPLMFAGREAWLVLVNDVTEKKVLEAQLFQAQKMESVGRLAGGVAHDFNNLLGVITGYGELLQRRLEDAPLKKYTSDILQAAERAARLTKQLLAFSRRQVLQPRVLDLNGIVEETEKMLRRLIGEDVALKTVLAPNLAPVRADRGQIEQVLMNLVVNARDAMPKGGRITIETSNANLDDAYARTHDAVPGKYVMLAISDTGHGMSREVRARLFEPFFTTKAEGKGTGLGLATVYGIVKQSSGHISVYSEPGLGSAFKVYLPRANAAPDQPEVAATPAAPLARGDETILLVEDEVSLRLLIRECLEDFGYEVLDARNGAEALERACDHEGLIQLLMTDVVMPGIGGRDLAERLTAAHPGIKVLYMSGYTDDAVVRHGVLSEKMDFLQKPFTHEALARKVREVLDRRG